MNAKYRAGLKGAFVLMLAAGLAACGGGSGGDASSPGGNDQVAQPGSGQGGGTGSSPAPTDGNGHALLSWEAPNTRADGSCLSDLTEFRINYGLSSNSYEHVKVLDTSGLNGSATGESSSCGRIVSYSYMLEGVPNNASWYFAVQAVDSAGNVSEFSNEVVKTIQ